MKFPGMFIDSSGRIYNHVSEDFERNTPPPSSVSSRPDRFQLHHPKTSNVSASRRTSEELSSDSDLPTLCSFDSTKRPSFTVPAPAQSLPDTLRKGEGPPSSTPPTPSMCRVAAGYAGLGEVQCRLYHRAYFPAGDADRVTGTMRVYLSNHGFVKESRAVFASLIALYTSERDFLEACQDARLTEGETNWLAYMIENKL